jgi:hypothetical protein
MSIPATVFSERKDEAAPAPSSLIARFGMTVCFLATTGLLVAGLRSIPSAEAGAHATPTIAITAYDRIQNLK